MASFADFGDIVGQRIKNLAGRELATENLDDVTAVGTYFQVSNANATVDRNYPVAGMSGALLNLPVIPSIGRFTQVFVLNHTVGASIYIRSKGSGGWSAWSTYMTQSSSDGRYYRRADVDAALAALGNTIPADSSEHDYRIAQLRARRGNVTVATPAVVVLAFDHGLTKFKSIVQPLLAARGLPVTLAVNSQLFTDPTNSGATTADLTTWAAGTLVEVANHGRTHTFTGNLTTEIRGGREELEAIIGQSVDTYIQAGVSGDTWGGNYADVAGTSRGRIAYAAHAIIAGVMPSATLLYPIGEQSPGAKGTWIDNGGATITAARAKITEAVNAKAMTIIRLHPEHIDGSGRITTAELTSFLDWLVTERNAGRITVMQLRDASIAKRTPAPYVIPDTGWRNIDTTLINGWTGGVRVRRIGATVEVRVEGIINAAPSPTSRPFALPAGFGTDGIAFARVMLHTTAAPPVPVRGYATDGLTLSSAPANTALYGSLVFTTASPWPTTMPGTAA